MTPNIDEAIAFLDGTGTDHLGRTVADYLKFDDDEWEACHNHVQWAFPSNHASAYNPHAPVIEDMKDFIERMPLNAKDNVTQLLFNYFKSLGVTFNIGSGFFMEFDLSERGQYWLTDNNHNFLRITRILNLFHFLGEPERVDISNAILLNLACLATHYSCIDKVTLLYWTMASTGHLNEFVKKS